MNFLPEEIEKYAEDFTSPESDVLKELNRETHSKIYMPQMLSGHLQGAALKMFSKMIQPKRILEIGTFTGYSALCLSKGLQRGGKIHTIELREEDAATARAYFEQSINKDKIVLHVGDAKQIIPTLNEVWDIVFIDADKTGYIDYYELILPSVKQSGIIIADNVLFHGQVLEHTISGKNAKAVDAFNEHVKNDKRVEQVLLTVRDGLLLIQKL